MNISADKIAKGINDFIFELNKAGLILDSRFHQQFTKSQNSIDVTWGNDGYVLKDNNFASIDEYLNLLEARQYSILLPEGDFFQISFSVQRNKIVKHRLCWYPCPIKVTSEEVGSLGVLDAVLDKIENADFIDFLSKSPVRFDFDPNSKSIDHPEVHMHLSMEDCRIPVKTPLCLRKFLHFIFKNFYADVKEITPLIEEAITWPGKDLLDNQHKELMHINIFQGI